MANLVFAPARQQQHEGENGGCRGRVRDTGHIDAGGVIGEFDTESNGISAEAILAHIQILDGSETRTDLETVARADHALKGAAKVGKDSRSVTQAGAKDDVAVVEAN